MLAILFMVSLLLRDPSTRDSALAELARVLPGGSQGGAFRELAGTVDAIRQGTGLLGVVGLLGLLWGGSGLFGTLETAFGVVYGFKPRPFLPGKLMASGMILVFAVLTLVGIAASSMLALLTPIADQSGAGEILTGPSRYLIEVGVGVLTGGLLSGLIYLVVPRGPRRLRMVLPGALLAAVAFELLTLIFPLYLRIAGSGNRYGQTFGLLLVVVTYAYLLAQILMLGACLNAEVEDRAVTGVRAPDADATRREDAATAGEVRLAGRV